MDWQVPGLRHRNVGAHMDTIIIREGISVGLQCLLTPRAQGVNRVGTSRFPVES